MADEKSRRARWAGTVAVAVTVVTVSIVLRETTDLGFLLRLLIALPLGVLAAAAAEALVDRRP